MKKYITILAICLSATLLFVPSANAATFSLIVTINPSTARLDLTDSYIVQYEEAGGQVSPVGDYCVAVYEGHFTPTLSGFSTDSYINGFCTYDVALTLSAPAGWYLNSFDIEFTPNNTITAFSSLRSWSSGTTSACRINSYFDNDWNNSFYQAGTITYRVTYQYAAPVNGVPDPTSYIGASTSINVTANNLNASTTPQAQGLVEQIIYAIDHGYPQILEDIYYLINDIKTQDQTQYTNLLTALNTSNDWNRTIFAELESLEQILSNIDLDTYTLTLDAATIIARLNSVIQFMTDYFPHITNIDTNTLNTYNQLLTIYNYINTHDIYYETIFSWTEGSIYTINSSNNNIYTLTNDFYSNRKCIKISRDSGIYKIYYRPYFNNSTLNMFFGNNGVYVGNDYTPYTNNNTYYEYIINWPEDATDVYINCGITSDIKLYYNPVFTNESLIIMYLRTIYNNFTQAETQVAEASQAEAVVASQANVIGAVSKPSISGMISEVNTRITPEVTSGMQALLAFINRPLFVTILVVVMSLAFVGYLFFGKGV